MDFKAALVSNIPTSGSLGKPQDLDKSSSGHEMQPTVPSTRRRRRRRQTNQQALTATHEHSGSQVHKPGLFQDPKAPSTFDGPPSLRLLQASPVSVEWEPEASERKPPLDFLQVIATRARERLAIRIQAHWEEQQNVAKIAAQMQAAYTAEMHSQLQAITITLQEQQALEIEARFAGHEKAWKETFDTAVKELRSEVAKLRFRKAEAAHDSLRINSLEAETRKLMEMLKAGTSNKSGEDGPSEAPTEEQTTDPQLVNTIAQLQAQANTIQSRIAGLHNTHEDTANALYQMQSAMVVAGLFSAPYHTNQIPKQGFPNYGPNPASFQPPAFEVDQRSNRAPSQAPSFDMHTYKENKPVTAAIPIMSPVNLKIKTETFPGTPQKHLRTFSHPLRMGMGRSPSSVTIGSPFGDSTNRL